MFASARLPFNSSFFCLAARSLIVETRYFGMRRTQQGCYNATSTGMSGRFYMKRSETNTQNFKRGKRDASRSGLAAWWRSSFHLEKKDQGHRQDNWVQDSDINYYTRALFKSISHNRNLERLEYRTLYFLSWRKYYKCF